jgi:translation initiation factor IF-3
VDEDGEQSGVMTLRDALNMAQERDMDLVEVAPGADPPVCRLLDYGRFRYVQTKKERESRKSQKSTELREVRFRPAIGVHDLEAKTRTIHKLLTAGSKVKVSVVFRGRSITHPELGVGLLKKVAEGLQDETKLEKAPSMEGRMMSIILAPLGRQSGVPVAQDAESEENEPGQASA